MELLHQPSPDLLFDKDTLLCNLLVSAIKGGFIVEYLKYINVGLLFLYFPRQSLRRGFEHQLQRDAQLPG